MTSTAAGQLAPGEAAGAEPVAWHGLTAEHALERLEAHQREGLDPAEVERRRAQYGPNKLAEPEQEPGWRAFLSGCPLCPIGRIPSGICLSYALRIAMLWLES